MNKPDPTEIQRLRESEAKYRKMIERANDGIFAIDTETAEVVEVNPKGVELTGYTADEIVGKKVWELHPRDEVEAAKELFEAVVSKGSDVCTTLHFQQKQGGRIAIDVSSSLITFGDKSIVQRICRDATVTRDLQSQVQFQLDYYNYILDMMPVGVGVRKDINTPNPTVVYQNKKLLEMFADASEDTKWHAASQNEVELRTMLDDTGVYAEERLYPSGKVCQFTLSYYRDLTDSWSELQVVRDVTLRRTLEKQLQESMHDLEAKVEERTRDLRNKQAQLVQSEKMAVLGNLVAGVAHEINTPIGALKSNNDLFIRSVKKLNEALLADDMDESVRNDAKLIKMLNSLDGLNSVNREALDRIVKIVNSLRKFARLDEADQARVDIHEGLESTLTLVHHEFKNRITVRKNYGTLPRISCYPNQLNQVFMNILVNAAQAIEGSGDIQLKTYQDGDHAVVEISDTGKGIPPEHLARIFDPGFTTKGSGVGTGLGLSIVFQIIRETHDGEIEVESKVGQGTTFRIRLPIN